MTNKTSLKLILNVDLSVRQVLLEINKIINLIESFSDCPSLVKLSGIVFEITAVAISYQHYLN